MQKTSLKRWMVRSVSGVAVAGAFLRVLALPASAAIVTYTGYGSAPWFAISDAGNECRADGGTPTGKVLSVVDLGGGEFAARIECNI